MSGLVHAWSIAILQRSFAIMQNAANPEVKIILFCLGNSGAEQQVSLACGLWKHNSTKEYVSRVIRFQHLLIAKLLSYLFKSLECPVLQLSLDNTIPKNV